MSASCRTVEFPCHSPSGCRFAPPNPIEYGFANRNGPQPEGGGGHPCRALLEAHRAGKVGEATRIHLAALDLIDALFATTNPIAVKWAMNHLGFAAGPCRLPLDGMPAYAIRIEYLRCTAFRWP